MTHRQIFQSSVPQTVLFIDTKNATDTINVRACDNERQSIRAKTSNGYLTTSTQSGENWQYNTVTNTEWTKIDLLTWTYTPTGKLSSTGSGEEFLPPYMTVYAWYRTA